MEALPSRNDGELIENAEEHTGVGAVVKASRRDLACG